MIRIAQVIDIDGRKYVPLETYQQLIKEVEELQGRLHPPLSNAEIVAMLGEDEVYSNR